MERHIGLDAHASSCTLGVDPEAVGAGEHVRLVERGVSRSRRLLAVLRGAGEDEEVPVEVQRLVPTTLLTSADHVAKGGHFPGVGRIHRDLFSPLALVGEGAEDLRPDPPVSRCHGGDGVRSRPWRRARARKPPEPRGPPGWISGSGALHPGVPELRGDDADGVARAGPISPDHEHGRARLNIPSRPEGGTQIPSSQRPGDPVRSVRSRTPACARPSRRDRTF